MTNREFRRETLTHMNPILKAFKAVRYLGLRKTWFYMVYQVGLFTGHYRRQTPSKMAIFSGEPGLPTLKGFPSISPAHLDELISEADKIRKGIVTIFGTHQIPLDLKAGASDKHWTELEKEPPGRDIKFIWEPARFGWALTLARAYAHSGNDIYAQDFWEKTLAFLDTHPPNLGRQWQSAQEVAIRLMVFVFCDRVFAHAPSSTPERRRRLWGAIAEHAVRIPPTMVYARAQNNNHLLSEAAGLYTAGIYLASHPQANKWRKLGWQWINWALQNQINEFGTYVQHSTNYHRLMLQLALYIDHIRRLVKEPWLERSLSRLKAAASWLWALTDPNTGQTPNLGANDSAYIFPLTQLPQKDYRPVVDAAGKAFLEMDIYQQPGIAEMADWFEIEPALPADQKQPHAPDMLRLSNNDGRAFIHTAHYTDRPSHADQLHVDLWWQDVNIALDPGTFQYNASPPWNNALITARVHNTLTVDGQDQMTKAGRFLWLDWAQAEILAHEIDESGEITRIKADHDGFRKLGARHQRTIRSTDSGWIIEDAVLPFGNSHDKIHQALLTWLLPDWVWQLEAGNQLRIIGQVFSFTLQIDGVLKLNLFRAGERLLGEIEPQPTWGWISPSYGIKQPGLMIKAEIKDILPITFQSIWQFK